MFIAFITLCLLFISSTNAHTQGVISIDSLTFHKILSRFHAVLVKFDDKFPFGGLQDEFKNLTDKVINARDFVIAEVPVTDRDNRENYLFALEYDALKPDFPVYRLFLNGKYKAIKYTGDRSSDDLKRFLLKHTNIWLGLPGTIEGLDHLARETFDASLIKDERTQRRLLKKAQDHVETLANKEQQKNGEFYLKTMHTIAEQGTGFLESEKRRLQNLLKGKVSKEKKEGLQHRENILSTFKSLKEPVTDTNDVPKDNVLETSGKNKEAIINKTEKAKKTVIGDRDL